MWFGSDWVVLNILRTNVTGNYTSHKTFLVMIIMGKKRSLKRYHKHVTRRKVLTTKEKVSRSLFRDGGAFFQVGGWLVTGSGRGGGGCLKYSSLSKSLFFRKFCVPWHTGRGRNVRWTCRERVDRRFVGSNWTGIFNKGHWSLLGLQLIKIHVKGKYFETIIINSPSYYFERHCQ